MIEPVTRAHEDGLVPDSSLSAEGKLRRAETALWGTSFRDEGKHGEPHDRQQGATPLHGRGGESVEVVRNHADGTRGGLAAHPRRETRRRGSWASDSSAPYDGGAIFGQPQERKSDRQVGPHGSGRDGKVGVKVRRVARGHGFVFHARPVVGTSRARRQWRRRPRRGAVEPFTAEATGDLPPWWPLEMGVDGANPSTRARAHPSTGNDMASPCPRPRGEWEVTGSKDPLRP
jgi:hypothetical protein